MFCEGCPQRGTSTVGVMGVGPVPAPLLIVAQHPSVQDEREGRPMYKGTWAGKRLRTLMVWAGMEEKEVRIEQVVRCRPPRLPGKGDASPNAEEVAACRSGLSDAIAACAPKIIVTLGQTALRWFFPSFNIGEWHGRPLEWMEDSGRWLTVVPMYHPQQAAPSRRPELADVMISDWKDLRKVIDGTGGTGGGNRRRVAGRVAGILNAVKEKDEYNYCGTNSSGGVGGVDSNDISETLVWGEEEFTLVSGQEMARLLEGVEAFAFDFETNDPRWKGTFQACRAYSIGYSISFDGVKGYYTTDAVEWIRGPLEDPNVQVIAHNAKFEYVVAKNHAIEITNLHCTKLMAYVLRRFSTHLKDLTWSELGIKQVKYEDVDWTDIEGSVVSYAAGDSVYTWRHAVNFTNELQRNGQWTLYDTVERPCLPYLGDMERRGILIDAVPLRELQQELLVEQVEVERLLETLYPYPINWSSPQQKANVLYGPKRWRVKKVGELKGRAVKGEEKVRAGALCKVDYIPPGLALRVKRRTATHQAETGMPALRLMFEEDGETLIPLADALIYRGSIQKMLTGDVIHLQDLTQEDGRVHTSLHQAGRWEEVSSAHFDAPETSRLSSSGPNLQNLTVHGDVSRPYIVRWGQKAAESIVAPDGWYIVKADVGQEEPRIGGALSEDEQFLYDLEYSDVYKEAAALAFGVGVETVDKEMRQIGKRMFMAWLNRAGASGIKKSAFWLTHASAAHFVHNMNERYAGFETWYNNLIADLRLYGYVETFFGHRCELPGIWSQGESDRAAAMREAVPMVIQGTGAGLLKVAIPRVGRECREEDSHLLLPVHDSIELEVREDALERMVAVCRGMVEGVIPNIVFPVDVEIGLSRGTVIDAEEWFERRANV